MDEDVRVTKRLWGLPKKNKRGSEPLLPPSRPHQFESPNIHVPALVHFPRTTFMPMSLRPKPIIQTARRGPALSCMGASGCGVIENVLGMVAAMSGADVGGCIRVRSNRGECMQDVCRRLESSIYTAVGSKAGRGNRIRVDPTGARTTVWAPYIPPLVLFAVYTACGFPVFGTPI